MTIKQVEKKVDAAYAKFKKAVATGNGNKVNDALDNLATVIDDIPTDALVS